MAERTPIVDRFWKHVVEIGGPMDTPCWTRRSSPNGTKDWYINCNGKMTSARRYAFLNIGRKTLGPKQQVSSLCGNSACCNPAHLFGATRQDIVRMTFADGKRDVMAIARWKAANIHRWQGANNPRTRHPESLIQSIREAKGKTTRQLHEETGLCMAYVLRIRKGLARPLVPRKSENPPILGHGHRGHRTQAHGREAGSGDGQAAATGCANR